MNLRLWFGCGLLGVAGCDAGGTRMEASSTGAGDTTSAAGSTLEDGPSGSVDTGMDTWASGSDGGAGEGMTSTGPSPADPPCDGWRTDVSEGFEGRRIQGLPGGEIAVGGAADGLARIEFFDDSGVPLWSFDHDPSQGAVGESQIIDIAAVGADRLLGVTSLPYPSPGFVFLLDLETHDVVWSRSMDSAYIDHPLDGPDSPLTPQGPTGVAVTSQGHLAVVSTAYSWEPVHLTMGLDPENGDRTWLKTVSADFSQSLWFAADDVADAFILVSSYSAFGGSSYQTRRWLAETGQGAMPAGPGGNGIVSGDIAVRSDGTLVLTLWAFGPDADTLEIVTQLPDGSSAGTLDVHTESFPGVVDTAVDGADRVYMLVGNANAADNQRLIRFNPDVSVDTVYDPDAQTELQGVMVTPEDDVVVLGRDRADFIERVCLAR